MTEATKKRRCVPSAAGVPRHIRCSVHRGPRNYGIIFLGQQPCKSSRVRAHSRRGPRRYPVADIRGPVVGSSTLLILPR